MINKTKLLTDIRQSENYANFLKSQGWIVEKNKGTYYFIKKIPILGGVLKIQRPKTINFDAIQRLSKKYRVFQIVLEPNTLPNIHNLIIDHAFRLSNSPFLPTKTLQIDLTQPIRAITAKFDKDTRYAIRRGGAIEIKEYSSPKDLEIFHSAWKKSVSFARFVPSLTSLLNLKESFPNNYSIFLASHNKVGTIIGGAIFTRSDRDFSYYWYGFTNHEGRTSLSQYSLLYNGILWAKRMSSKVFDFEGIYDDRFPIKSWLGFSHFKRSFGGVETLYPGCYIKFHHLLNIKQLYRLFF